MCGPFLILKTTRFIDLITFWDDLMLKKLALPLLLICSGFASADESDFLKPRNNDAFDNYMLQAARFEAELFKHDKPSAFDAYFIGPLKPSEIRAAYERNELAAKKKYTNHSIRIKGEISSINENAFGNGYIVAVDRVSRMSAFEGIHLQINKNDPVYLELGKGDRIDAICQVGTYTLGIPSMSKCFLTSSMFRPEVFNNFTLNLIGNPLLKAKTISVENIAKIKVRPLLKTFIVYASSYKDNEDGNERACRNDDATCEAALMHNIETSTSRFPDAHQQDFNALGARLRELWEK